METSWNKNYIKIIQFSSSDDEKTIPKNKLVTLQPEATRKTSKVFKL